MQEQQRPRSLHRQWPPPLPGPPPLASPSRRHESESLRALLLALCGCFAAPLARSESMARAMIMAEPDEEVKDGPGLQPQALGEAQRATPRPSESRLA
jgi:hypothetical protein